METPDKRIWIFFKYAQEAFRNAGINLKLPKNTDPKKTYAWRYLNHFYERVEKWGISNSTAQKLIEAIVIYSKKNNQLKRGFAVLSSDNILEIGYKEINREITSQKDILVRLRNDFDMLSRYEHRVQTLLDRPSRGALPNIIQWYIQGRLSKLYLSVSKSCSVAMSKLSKFELSMLPSYNELLLLRRTHFNNVLIRHKAKSILGEEWTYGS